MDKISRCQNFWMKYRINCHEILKDFIKKTDEEAWTRDLICDGFVICYDEYSCSCHQLFSYNKIITKEKFINLCSLYQDDTRIIKYRKKTRSEKSLLNKLKKENYGI